MKRELLIAVVIIIAVLFVRLMMNCSLHSIREKTTAEKTVEDRVLWKAPDTSTIPGGEKGELIKYGRQLIIRTAYFLGPKGKVKSMSNGMNCQNCHLDAGARPWGNNYAGVASTYPKYRERSGSIESIEKKINDCLERSMNGVPLDSNSRELRAMVAYMHWLGKDVKKGEKPFGSGITNLEYLSRPADPLRGKTVYIEKCQRCHSTDGGGQLDPTDSGYTYPPLWGIHSYNSGAGIFRLSKFAGFVKDNMPFKDTLRSKLTNEEAWDVAAFVNSQSRPGKDISGDWPVMSTKPVDHPFGPFSDTFSEQQHKYGPFEPIAKMKK